MCGIAGYFFQHAPHNHAVALDCAVDLMEHRGPDGSGVWVNESKHVGFAHTRLSILDLSDHGSQPMVLNRESPIVLTFNGEIYNFRELRTELTGNGVDFFSSSDTEVLLKLYESSNGPQDFLENYVHKLNGIFAFSIWDQRRKIGFVVRDSFGVKPVYYTRNDHELIFASEMKPILGVKECFNWHDKFKDIKSSFVVDQIEPRLCSSSILEHLVFLWNSNGTTLFKNIHKLKPGGWLLFREGQSIEEGQWSSALVNKCSRRHRAKSMKSVECYVKQVQHLFKEAVQSQMISDVPVGAFLSGGLDSSAIVAVAKEVNPNLNCFTIVGEGFEKEGFGEDYEFAKVAARHTQVPLHSISVSPDRFMNDLPDMIRILEEPTADPSALNVLFISQLARQNGIKVLLSGTGGDDVFSGYRRHLAVHYFGGFEKIPYGLRKGTENFFHYLNSNNILFRRIKKLMSGLSMNSNEYLINCFKWNNDVDLKSVLSKELSINLGGYNPGRLMRSVLNDEMIDDSLLKRCLSLERRFFLGEHNLLYTDKMSMATGVEVRVPFLDNNLVNFSREIPANMLVKGMSAKWIFKRAMEPYLPRKIIYRPKTGFGLPVRQWIKNEMSDYVNDILSERVLRDRGLFNPSGVKAMIKANTEGSVDASYTILSMICIELWCRQFIDI